jgi:hypothetical protein
LSGADAAALPSELTETFGRIEAAFAVARAHPLSSRKTLLVAVLLDNFCDQAFEALRFAAPTRVFLAEDVLAFRERLRAEEPALGLIFDLCAGSPGGPRLETRAVRVPIEDYEKLSIEDFMVSLYNANTVQRVMIVSTDGSARLAHEVLGPALAYWRKAGPDEAP